MPAFPRFQSEGFEDLFHSPVVYPLLRKLYLQKFPDAPLPENVEDFMKNPLLVHQFLLNVPGLLEKLSDYVGDEELSWDDSWGQEWIASTFRSYLKRSQDAGALQGNILDVGSSSFPVTAFLDPDVCKVIELDIAAQGSPIGENRLRLRANIENLFLKSKAERAKLEGKISHFLDLPQDRPCDPAQLDVVVFSQILRYVDFRKIVQGIVPFLRENAEVYIYDIPTRTIPHLESSEGLKDNNVGDLLNVLILSGFQIEDSQISEVETMIHARRTS
jgi:hypothetical protein